MAVSVQPTIWSKIEHLDQRHKTHLPLQSPGKSYCFVGYVSGDRTGQSYARCRSRENNYELLRRLCFGNILGVLRRAMLVEKDLPCLGYRRRIGCMSIVCRVFATAAHFVT